MINIFLTGKRALYETTVENIISPRKDVICVSTTKAEIQTHTQNMQYC